MKINPSASIHFFSESIPYVLKRKQEIRKWLLRCIASEKKTPGTLNFIFCNDRYLRKMNKEFLNHDYNTDVITFPSEEKNISGDIFISIDRVRDNAKTYGVRVSEELRRVMIHGVLHLCGYGDKTEKEIKKMRMKENFYITKRGL